MIALVAIWAGCLVGIAAIKALDWHLDRKLDDELMEYAKERQQVVQQQAIKRLAMAMMALDCAIWIRSHGRDEVATFIEMLRRL